MSRRRFISVTPVPAVGDPARARLPWFDAIWEKLPVSARRAFVVVAQGESEEGISEDDLAVLEDQALVWLDDDRVVNVQQGAEPFADRIAKLADHPVLFAGSPRDLEGLLAGSPPPPALVTVALASVYRRRLTPGEPAELDDVVRAVRSVDWLRHMPPMIERLPGVQRALGLLAANVGLLPISRLAAEVGAEAYPALETLVTHFVAFEGLEPKTLRLMVGLLPSLRGDGDDVDVDPDDSVDELALDFDEPPPPPKVDRSSKGKAKEKQKRPAPDPVLPQPPDPVPRPGELDISGQPLVLDDLESMLVVLASRRVRVSQRGDLYVEDEAAAVEQAFAGRPNRVVPPLTRGNTALNFGERLKLVEHVDVGPGIRVVKPTAAACAFLEQPLARRWRAAVELCLEDRQGWLGGSLDQSARSLGPWPPEPSSAAITLAPFVDLVPGEFYVLDALLARWRGELNPLYRLLLARMKQRGLGGQEHQHLIVSQLRYVLDDPELARDPLGALDRSYARGVQKLLVRLAAIGGVEIGDALGDRATFALTAVGRHYLGFEKRFPKLQEPPAVEARVVVQPNLEVLVIGRAPAAQLALSRIATPKEGESGPARTFVLSRERVIEAIAHGARPDSIARTLQDAAQGADIPLNVLRTLNDWARAVRRVKVVHVPVLVCDDEETALTIRSHAGKGVLVADHGVPVDPTKLAAFKRTLLKKGIVVDEDPRDDKRRRR